MNRVGKIVPPKRVILKDISLSFFPGAKIGVLGLNGSGKSSLLRIMAGEDKEYDGEAVPMPDHAHRLPAAGAAARSRRRRCARPSRRAWAKFSPRRSAARRDLCRVRGARRRFRRARRRAGAARGDHRGRRRRLGRADGDRRRRAAAAAVGREDRPTCRAARSAASRCAGCCCRSPTCCCSTSRPTTSMPRASSGSSSSCRSFPAP